jgi:type I restriction-modification system DNA methylase subunit
MNPYAKDIIKHLDRITASGNRPSIIFQDFLDMTRATLEAIPAHLRSVLRDGAFAPDTEETAKLFERMRNRYETKYYWEHFANAFYALLDSADGEDGEVIWDDTIGQVYMEWGVPNKHTGQFFTPFEIARMMAALTLADIEDQLFQRLETAYLKTPTGKLHELITSSQQVSAFVRKLGGDLVPMCAEHIEPITINDCACGSGVMFLAAAEQTPRWALNWGLVQFYGQDIDQACVTMCKINMMIYGLNGFNLKNALELSQAELAGIPEPYAGKYAEAQANPDRVEEISAEVRAWKQEALL